MHIQSIVIKMSLILWESLRSSNMWYSWTNEMEISNKVLKWYESSKTTYISRIVQTLKGKCLEMF